MNKLINFSIFNNLFTKCINFRLLILFAAIKVICSELQMEHIYLKPKFGLSSCNSQLVCVQYIKLALLAGKIIFRHLIVSSLWMAFTVVFSFLHWRLVGLSIQRRLLWQANEFDLVLWAFPILFISIQIKPIQPLQLQTINRLIRMHKHN